MEIARTVFPYISPNLDELVANKICLSASITEQIKHKFGQPMLQLAVGLLNGCNSDHQIIEGLALHLSMTDSRLLLQQCYNSENVHQLDFTSKFIDGEQFGRYLTKAIQSWRLSKTQQSWPWRHILEEESDRVSLYLQRTLIENYHFVRAAMWKQATALLGHLPPTTYQAIREFVVEEAFHEKLFMDALRAWDIDDVPEPLIGTKLFIAHQRSLGLQGALFYAAGSAVIEIHAEVMTRVGNPYDAWKDNKKVPCDAIRSVALHVTEDSGLGHAELLPTLCNDLETIPRHTCAALYRAARDTFIATWIWQRDVYESTLGAMTPPPPQPGPPLPAW